MEDKVSEVGEIYHRPLLSSDLQTFRVKSTEDSEKFFRQNPLRMKTPPKLTCDHILPFFKCHSKNDKVKSQLLLNYLNN